MKNVKHLLAGVMALALCLSASTAQAQNVSNTGPDGSPVIEVFDLNPDKPPYMPPPLQLGLGQQDKLQVNFYPNPCQDQLKIETGGTQAAITIYNLTGKVELRQTVENGDLLNVSHLQPGIYILNDGAHSLRLQKL